MSKSLREIGLTTSELNKIKTKKITKCKESTRPRQYVLPISEVRKMYEGWI